MGIKISGDTMVFCKDFDGRKAYSIGISKKKEDGTYDKAYFPVQFKKDVVVENMTKIDIKNAWFSFYTTKGGEKKPYLFIGEFESDAVPQQLTEVDMSSDEYSPF